MDDRSSLNMLNAFKARLEGVNSSKSAKATTNGTKHEGEEKTKPDAPDEEAILCDLHFIANCQSCSNWADDGKDDEIDNVKDKSFLNHSLTFEKNRLGKDLSWKQKNEDELVVIDPRDREKELGIKSGSKQRPKEWDRRKEERRERGR